MIDIFDGNRKNIFLDDRETYMQDGFASCKCGQLLKLTDIRINTNSLTFKCTCDYGCEKFYQIQKWDLEYIISEYIAGRRVPNFHFLRWFRLATLHKQLFYGETTRQSFVNYCAELVKKLRNKVFILDSGRKCKFKDLKI